ncbi:hypothetical protein FNF29_02847 [Cafeteria roenbergensis]|uniref:Uncharacterized protein n=1 Tax=Cafeteria roenbergensis TaxID=33653 RepID=A0A5A8CMC4_CAFRO|nr:hypothetical protein FNF29_02847 [Cafeteria roenbergensis]|eukprot:KAA0153858.1 hypothetical protein FNF29_02847 [Cafeteria roenbergensis]
MDDPSQPSPVASDDASGSTPDDGDGDQHGAAELAALLSSERARQVLALDRLARALDPLLVRDDALLVKDAVWARHELTPGMMVDFARDGASLGVVPASAAQRSASLLGSEGGGDVSTLVDSHVRKSGGSSAQRAAAARHTSSLAAVLPPRALLGDLGVAFAHASQLRAAMLGPLSVARTDATRPADDPARTGPVYIADDPTPAAKGGTILALPLANVAPSPFDRVLLHASDDDGHSELVAPSPSAGAGPLDALPPAHAAQPAVGGGGVALQFCALPGYSRLSAILSATLSVAHPLLPRRASPEGDDTVSGPFALSAFATTFGIDEAAPLHVAIEELGAPGPKRGVGKRKPAAKAGPKAGTSKSAAKAAAAAAATSASADDAAGGADANAAEEDDAAQTVKLRSRYRNLSKSARDTLLTRSRVAFAPGTVVRVSPSSLSSRSRPPVLRLLVSGRHAGPVGLLSLLAQARMATAPVLAPAVVAVARPSGDRGSAPVGWSVLRNPPVPASGGPTRAAGATAQPAAGGAASGEEAASAGPDRESPRAAQFRWALGQGRSCNVLPVPAGTTTIRMAGIPPLLPHRESRVRPPELGADEGALPGSAGAAATLLYAWPVLPSGRATLDLAAVWEALGPARCSRLAAAFAPAGPPSAPERTVGEARLLTVESLAVARVLEGTDRLLVRSERPASRWPRRRVAWYDADPAATTCRRPGAAARATLAAAERLAVASILLAPSALRLREAVSSDASSGWTSTLFRAAGAPAEPAPSTSTGAAAAAAATSTSSSASAPATAAHLPATPAPRAAVSVAELTVRRSWSLCSLLMTRGPAFGSAIGNIQVAHDPPPPSAAPTPPRPQQPSHNELGVVHPVSAMAETMLALAPSCASRRVAVDDDDVGRPRERVSVFRRTLRLGAPAAARPRRSGPWNQPLAAAVLMEAGGTQLGVVRAGEESPRLDDSISAWLGSSEEVAAAAATVAASDVEGAAAVSRATLLAAHAAKADSQRQAGASGASPAGATGPHRTASGGAPAAHASDALAATAATGSPLPPGGEASSSRSLGLADPPSSSSSSRAAEGESLVAADSPKQVPPPAGEGAQALEPAGSRPCLTVASVTERLTLGQLAGLAGRNPLAARYLWSPGPFVPGPGRYSGADTPVRGAPEVLAELLEAPTVRWQGFARIRRVALARLGHARGTEAAWRDTLGEGGVLV